MTTKRFKIKLSDIGELMDCETKNLLAVHSIARELIPLCDLLNSLNDENKQLKHSIKCLEADKMELQQYIKRMQDDVE